MGVFRVVRETYIFGVSGFYVKKYEGQWPCTQRGGDGEATSRSDVANASAVPVSKQGEDHSRHCAVRRGEGLLEDGGV